MLKKATLFNPFLSDRFCIAAYTLTVITEHVSHFKSSFWNKLDRTTYSIFNEILHEFLYNIKSSLLLVKVPHLPLSWFTVAAHSHLKQQTNPTSLSMLLPN